MARILSGCGPRGIIPLRIDHDTYDIEAEAALNSLHNHKVTIAGHDLHCAHVPDAPPLLLTHGQVFGSYVAAHLGNARTDRTRGIHITLMALPRVLPELAEPTGDE